MSTWSCTVVESVSASDLAPRWPTRLDTFPVSWRMHVAATPRISLGDTWMYRKSRTASGKTLDRWDSESKVLPVNGSCAVLTTAPPACDAHGCELEVYVAMRRGEQPRVATDDAAPKLLMGVHRHVGSGFTPDEFEPLAPERPLGRARSLSFTADWDAWYRLDLRAPGGAPGLSWPVCLTLLPGSPESA